MRILRAIVALSLVVGACGDDATDSPSTTAQPATSTTAAVGVTTTDGPAPTATTSTSTTTTAAPAEGPGAELLVAGPSGVFLVAADGTAALLVDSPAVYAIDDLNGGVLFQIERWSRERRSIVYRVAADGAAAVETLVPTPEQGLTLNGMAVDGDETFVYYSRNEGSSIDDTRETLRRYSLQTREVTELSEVGGWEASSFPISTSESLILLNWSAEVFHGMNFTDLRANEATVAADPDPPSSAFEDCGICPRLGELSADGGWLAYVERADGARQVVIRHVASGAEIRRIELPDADWTPLSLDLTTEHLVVNRRSNEEVLDAWIYDLSEVDPQPAALGVAGEAYMTLSPVSAQGPIPAP